MAQSGSRALRAALALPFIGLSILCLGAMDTNKLIAHQVPFLEAGHVAWEGGIMPIFDRFYNVAFVDNVWRGITVTFSSAYIPLDAKSWWQLSSFLHELGPMYSVWLLESCRAGNSRTPAYAATFFTFAAQLLGIGIVAPVYYFLHVTFAPSAAALAHGGGGSPGDGRRLLRAEQARYLLPLFLALHTFEVVRAFTAPEPETRQYWIWAWQMSPLWIGVANSLLCGLADAVVTTTTTTAKAPSKKEKKSSTTTIPLLLLGVMCAVSSSMWLYTLTSAPYPPSHIFIPDSAVYPDYIRHTRKALQCDEVYSFGAGFLWLIYMFFDLHAAGLVGTGSLLASALLPLLAAVTGPGTAFAAGWYWRERVLSSLKSA